VRYIHSMIKAILTFSTLLITLLLLSNCVFPGDQGNPNYRPGELDGYNRLFDHDNLHQIEIQLSQSEWDAFIAHLETDIRSGRYFEADFIYTGAAGNTTIEDVGFRIKGNTTREIPYDTSTDTWQRAHFKIKFYETFGLTPGTSDFNTLDKRKFCTLTTLNLKWSNGDISQVRELYAYDLINRAGVMTAKTGSATLTITVGGTPHYFGVYTLIEPINKQFLKKHFNSNSIDGNLYKCLWQNNGPATLESDIAGKIGIKDWETGYRPSYQLKTNEDTADFNDLLSFVSTINQKSGSDFNTYISSTFNVDAFLKYLAINVIIGMPDDYWAMGNNYFLYLNNSGKYQFIPYDYDHAFGGGWHPFATETVNVETWNLIAPGSRPLVDKILANPAWMSKYKHYLQEFITPTNRLFLYSDYETRWDKLHTLYIPHLDNDINQGETMDKDAEVQSYFYEKTGSIIDQLGLDPGDYEESSAGSSALVLDTPLPESQRGYYYTSGDQVQFSIDEPAATAVEYTVEYSNLGEDYYISETSFNPSSPFTQVVPLTNSSGDDMLLYRITATITTPTGNIEASTRIYRVDSRLVSPEISGNDVIFRYFRTGLAGTETIFVKGTFNSWNTTNLMSWNGSYFECTFTGLDNDIYLYKFHETSPGDEWDPDPANPEMSVNDAFNSLLYKGTLLNPSIDGINDGQFYSLSNVEPASDGPGAGNHLELPGALYSYIDSSYIYLFIPLNNPTTTKRYISVFASNAGNDTTSDITDHPDGSNILVDPTWKSLYAEGDLYYCYTFSQDTLVNTNDESIVKYYNSGSGWNSSPNTSGTVAVFNNNGFEMRIPNSTIHADIPGNMVNIGVVLKQNGLDPVDSIGGDNVTTPNRVYIAASLAIP
jgi:spore coat protein CotH